MFSFDPYCTQFQLDDAIFANPVTHFRSFLEKFPVYTIGQINNRRMK